MNIRKHYHGPDGEHPLNRDWRYIVTTRAGRIVGRYHNIEPAESCAYDGRERDIWRNEYTRQTSHVRTLGPRS